jgi:HEAT repeats
VSDPAGISFTVQIDDILGRLAGEQTADRRAAHDLLVTMGAEAVGPVLAVLCDVTSPVPWHVSADVLRDLGEVSFGPVRDALAAATDREVRRRCAWTFHHLEVADLAVYLPALAHPSPEVRKSAAFAFQQAKERSEPHLDDLAVLLADPDDQVRQRAVWAFEEIGAVAVPLLRAIRRGGGRRRAAALTALAGIGGWDALESADRAAVTRLLAVKSAGEIPEPMHLCGSWWALPTTDQAAVLDAFTLVDPVPVTMRLGESAWNYDHHAGSGEHASCRRMYVTPALDGWTLVFGSSHLDTTGDDKSDEAALRDDVLARTAALSSRFGAAHWYGASCGDEWTAWCIAEKGRVVRYYDVFEPDDQIGDGHPAEQGYQLPHEDAFPDDAFDGVKIGDSDAFRARYGQVKEELDIPDDAHATSIAARISVDPESLGPQTVVTGRALLAVTVCNVGRPSPNGALRI